MFFGMVVAGYYSLDKVINVYMESFTTESFTQKCPLRYQKYN